MNQEIRRKLDRITDILWAGGVVNPVTYIEQISYLIYLKLLDEEESSRELQARLKGGKRNGNGRLLFPGQAERYRWSKWCFRSGPELRDYVRDQVFPYMASLVKEEPQIAEYFRDAILEIVDPNVLKQVVDELNGIDFRKLGTDVKGDIFEYLLTHLGQSALNGQFRTPLQIRKAMVAMTDPDLGDTIQDPACGTAGFLIDAVEHVLAKYSEPTREVPIYGEEWLERATEEQKKLPTLQTYRKGAGEKLPKWEALERSIFGFDVSRQMMRISMMNLVLHGIRKAQVKRANTLSDMGGLSEEDLRRRYKVILSNPPFAGMLPKESIRKDLPTNSKKSELLFLGVMMESLAPGGRCAVVVPEGLLFGSTGAHVELRKKLMESFEILAVVSLPAGVFKPYAGVKTAILVFRRPADAKAKKASRVWFYDVRADGYDPDKISGGGRPETPERNDLPDLLGKWEEYKASGFRKPPGIEANSVLPPGSEEPRSWWAERSAILENDCNLAAGRYHPQVAEKPPDVDPAQLIREALALEREIAEGLEKLLEDVAEFTSLMTDPITSPKKWHRGNLGDVILETQYGTSIRANREQKGFPVIRMNNIGSDGLLDVSDLKHVELSAKEFAKYELMPGDLLFNRTNSADLVGKTALWGGNLKAVAASYLIRVRVDKQAVRPEFVWGFMNSPQIKQILQGKARRAIGMANINAQELRALPFSRPPKEVQDGFVGIYNRWLSLCALGQQRQCVSVSLVETLLALTLAGEPLAAGKILPAG